MKLERVFLALDQMTGAQALGTLTHWSAHLGAIKIGMELFYKEGPAFWDKVKKHFEGQIFLDLKLHDIPVTVSSSIAALAPLNPDFLTIHLSGGRPMIEAALEAVDKYNLSTKLLGVSLLTSLTPNIFSETNGVAPEHFLKTFDSLISLALTCKIPGIILSPQELSRVQNASLLKVCPGIRFGGTENDDQNRVASPQGAFDLGADYLVIGRSLRQSPNPEVLFQILKELEKKYFPHSKFGG